jgi:hypothetical protein
MQRAGGLGGDLVLHGDVRAPALPVLRREMIAERCRDPLAEVGQRVRFQCVGDAAPGEAHARHGDLRCGLRAGERRHGLGHARRILARQVVEQRRVGGDVVQRLGKMPPSQTVEGGEGRLVHLQGQDQRGGLGQRVELSVEAGASGAGLSKMARPDRVSSGRAVVWLRCSAGRAASR